MLLLDAGVRSCIGVFSVNKCWPPNPSQVCVLKSLYIYSREISAEVSWMHSRPYKSLDLTMTLNTCIFHLVLVFALFQKSLSRLHVAIQSLGLFEASALLSKVSDSMVPTCFSAEP